MTGKRGRRRKHLLVDLKETRGYWKVKEDSDLHSVENSLRKMLWTCHETD